MSRRLSIVDLTSVYPSSDRRLSNSSSHDRRRSREAYQTTTPTPRGVKRRRQDDGFWSSESVGGDEQVDESIESIDLTEPENPLAKTLAKQREDAIKAQQTKEEEKGRSILGSYKCPVCMDTPEDATSTACGTFGRPTGNLHPVSWLFDCVANRHSSIGHLFCHRCIIEYLNSADQRFDPSKQSRGTCPICRKAITRVDKSGPKRSLIPLQLKLTTKKRSAVPPAEA